MLRLKCNTRCIAMALSSDAVGPCNPSQSFFITQEMERLILSHIALTPLPAPVFRWSHLSRSYSRAFIMKRCLSLEHTSKPFYFLSVAISYCERREERNWDAVIVQRCVFAWGQTMATCLFKGCGRCSSMFLLLPTNPGKRAKLTC